MKLWLLRAVWCTMVTMLAVPWFVFCTFLDGSPRDWLEFMGEGYRAAWRGEEP